MIFPSRKKIIQKRRSLRNTSCVYFLLDHKEIVYVGQSMRGDTRIFEHIKMGKNSHITPHLYVLRML